MPFNLNFIEKYIRNVWRTILEGWEGSDWVNNWLLNAPFEQEYAKIIIFTTVALLLCLLLASAAYLLSLGRIKDHEKLSEYECGFEPFDNASRLPFDVHFYVVGILFLIFDVEIALLFPWVMGLFHTGFQGFFTVILFLLILSVGFAYEWRRGALLWPHKMVRQSR